MQIKQFITHLLTINHSVGSKRFRPVSEQSTRSESQIWQKTWRIFLALVPFFLRPILLCLSLLRNQKKKAGYAGYINQGMFKVEIYKFAVINVHFRISRLFCGSICRRVTEYDYTLKNFNINYGLCFS